MYICFVDFKKFYDKANRTGLEVSPTPTLYNSAKWCKLAGYMECKRNKWKEVLGVFRKGKFELLTLAETKLKENGEASGFRVSGTRIISYVQEIERAREGVALLLNDVWYSAMIDFRYVSS